MDHRGVDPALVHQGDGLCGGEGRDLPMRLIARQAAPPDVDLGIDDLHGVISCRDVPSAAEAVLARWPQRTTVGETVRHDKGQRLLPAQPPGRPPAGRPASRHLASTA